MLTFIGLGLYDERSITRQGAATLASADYAYLEGYTSVLPGVSVERLETVHDTEIELIGRATVERHPGEILDRARDAHVAFLTGGDPMIATTHIDLRLRAADRGIETRLVHGTSAATAAAGLTGLQQYRFGRSVTVPAPQHTADGGVPPSVLDAIDRNRNLGLHTLLYLDLHLDDVDRTVLEEELTERCLDAATAARLLSQTHPAMLAVVVARAGSDDPLVRADRLDVLADGSFGDPLHLLVVPGQLHEMEARALETFADAPASLVESSRI